jgi:UDP-glucose 4-epimerase
MDSILVTGGAGYIGSHTIVELLNSLPYQIISIDNLSNSSATSYDRIQKIAGKEFKTFKADLCNLPEVERVLSPFRIKGIIHFAALKSVPDSVADPLLYYHNNIESLVNVLKFAAKHEVSDFIFSSSCSVYGNADELPVTEETPLKKSESPYASTKQMGEEIINFFCNTGSVNTVILRYFNPVGAHPSGQLGELPINKPNNLVPVITQTAVGRNSLTVFGNDYNTRDGSCVRDYVHVCDIARAHVQALEYLQKKKNKERVSLFNLGTGNGVTVLEAIRSFEKVSGKKLNYSIGARRAGDVEAIYANNDLAKQELGWLPEYDLDDMMLSAWKWQQYLEATGHRNLNPGI